MLRPVANIAIKAAKRACGIVVTGGESHTGYTTDATCPGTKIFNLTSSFCSKLNRRVDAVRNLVECSNVLAGPKAFPGFRRNWGKDSPNVPEVVHEVSADDYRLAPDHMISFRLRAARHKATAFGLSLPPIAC
jgi:hypothetical protein